MLCALLCLGLMLSASSPAAARQLQCTDYDCGGFNMDAVCAWQYGDRNLGVMVGDDAYSWKCRVKGDGAVGMDLNRAVQASAGTIRNRCGVRNNAVLRPFCGEGRNPYCWRIIATTC